MNQLELKIKNFISKNKKKDIIKIGINLDLHPEQRYQCLICHFDIPKLKDQFQKLYQQYLPSFPGLDTILSAVTYLVQGKIMYYSEIEYWAKIFEMSFHQVVVMQLLYEINSGCTTFISSIDGKDMMIRTFDWPEELLKEIIYQASYYRNGKKIYEGISILGSVGLFTGKNKDYSMAINYRRVNEVSLKSIFNNFLNTVSSYWPVSYLLRYCLENELSYSQSLEILKAYPVISPVYYSINGFGYKPLIIQRDPKEFKLITGDFTIQTNCDNCDVDEKERDDNREVRNIEYSIERFLKVKKILEKEKEFERVIKSIMKFPIIRDDTIYISICTDEIFETMIL